MERARAGDERAFAELTDPYRRELQVHCYRMMGSLTDAEDMLQETLLAAWQDLPGFERRSSLRTWRRLAHCAPRSLVKIRCRVRLTGRPAPSLGRWRT